MSKRTETSGRFRFIIITFIRITLILASISALSHERWLVLGISLIALLITFIPKFFEKQLGIHLPAAFEVIVILFIYGTLFLGEIRGFYSDFWWWDILLNLGAAIALGFVGLTVLYVLYKDEKIDASPLVITIFAFCFAVAVGAVWEVFEFLADNLFGFNLQKSATDTMIDLAVNSIGALVVATGGYFYLRLENRKTLSGMIVKVIEKNPKLFRSEKKKEDSEGIMKLISSGESEKLEFKSTLRTNLHTNQLDKKIELSALKTLVAFLNSNGGTLLVGVSNTGEVTGIEKDNFPNDDKLSLHVTNIIKQHIGREFLSFINHKIISIDNKQILRIDCGQGNKRAFLKTGQEEEFYIRNGPSSLKLDGSALIDYVNQRFLNSS